MSTCKGMVISVFFSMERKKMYIYRNNLGQGTDFKIIGIMGRQEDTLVRITGLEHA